MAGYTKFGLELYHSRSVIVFPKIYPHSDDVGEVDTRRRSETIYLFRVVVQYDAATGVSELTIRRINLYPASH